MRLIGNKTKLLSSIEEFLRNRGYRSGTFIDIFSGTASVGRHFKKLGYRVISNDILSSCYSQAVAGIEVSRYPDFRKFLHARRRAISSSRFQDSFLREQEFEFVRDWESGRNSSRRSRRRRTALRKEALPLRQAIHFLDRFAQPREGLIFRNYCPGGPHRRMYFRDEHGRKIDGILEVLREAHRSRFLDHGELHLLLVALIDAADRVANISGTYGAFLKKWQTNTRGELRLEPPPVIESTLQNEAHQVDSNRLIRRLEGDILYIDPPYNRRQFAANYHILEILAEHHRIDNLRKYEEGLYGKTGLRPYQDLKSLYSIAPGGRGARDGDVYTALSDLILSSSSRCVVVSYNEEGILSREMIGKILARYSGVRSFDFKRNLQEIDYQRFRSDADRSPERGSGGRRYRVLDGRSRNRTGELLFFAGRGGKGRGSLAGVARGSRSTSR